LTTQQANDLPISQALRFLLLISLLTSILFIIIGIAFKTDKTKKTYRKKFIIRGIVGLILTFIIWFIVSIIVSLFSWDFTGSRFHRFD